MQKLLPKKIESIWMATTPVTNYQTLEKDLETDVVVIGGGMAGLCTAYFLKKQGLKVAVLEAGRIAAATSGNTTAKVTSLHGLRYAYLIKTFGFEKAQIYADSNQWAVSEIEQMIRKENIDCDFYKAPAFTYTKHEDDLEEIKQEVESALKLKLPASFATHIPNSPLKIKGAVKFDNQAYFHPRKFLLKIADLINKDESFIRENTRAVDIKEGKNFCEIKTSKATIKAKYVVMATNFPFYDPDKIFSRLERSGSFVIAVTPESGYPDSMYIGTKSLDMSSRPHKDREKEWVIIGARHTDRPEGKNMDENFELLADLADKNIKIKSIDYKWGAADTMSKDRVPYIGKMPGFEKLLVATGFSVWGMTSSIVSARLLTDLILGEKNEWEELYDPGRLRESH